MVPVLRDADSLSLAGIESAIAISGYVPATTS